MQTLDRQGFTLIELLVVVIIVGLLAAIALPRFTSARERSQVSTMASDLRNLAYQQEIYHNDNFSFSTDKEELNAVESDGVTITIHEASGSGWAATATHSGIPGEQCGIYHGDADPSNGDPATVESVVMCTDP